MLYRLPAASSPEFAEQFEDSWGGVLLTSLYTEILKGAGDMQEVFTLPLPRTTPHHLPRSLHASQLLTMSSFASY